MSLLRRFRQWNYGLGPAAIVAINIAVCTFSYFAVLQIHRFCHQHGWWKSQSTFDIQEIFVALVTGFILGAMEVYDSKRAKETAELKAAGKDRTMI